MQVPAEYILSVENAEKPFGKRETALASTGRLHRSPNP